MRSKTDVKVYKSKKREAARIAKDLHKSGLPSDVIIAVLSSEPTKVLDNEQSNDSSNRLHESIDQIINHGGKE